MPAEPEVTFASLFRDRFALSLIAASLFVRLILAASVGPGFDEAYYHLFARNLAWGYFDHPPAVALTAGLGMWISGLWTPVLLRLGAVLMFTFTLPGVYLLAGRLYNRDAGRLALLLLHATPFFLVGAGAFVIPDNALLFAWVWALVVAERLRNSSSVNPRMQASTGMSVLTSVRRTALFLLLGALTGLGLLAKYHALLLPASLVVASVYDRELRRWWRDGRLYLALFVALWVFAPVIWWNANNGWISFAEQFGKSASGQLRLRFDLIGQAVGGQLGYLTPWVAVAVWWGAFRIRIPPVPRISVRGQKGAGDFTRTEVHGLRGVAHGSELTAQSGFSDRWLAAFFLVPVAGFTLIGLTRGILPHWTMPGYAAAFVLASGGFVWTKRVRRNAWIAVGINLVLVVLVVVQARTGLIPLNPKSDPTLDPVGWREAIVELEQSGELRDNDLLFAHKWFTAGELAWADRGEHELVLLGDEPHMFAWWAPESWYMGWSGVFITQARYGIDPEKHFASRFAQVEPLPLDSVRCGDRWVRMKAWRLTDLQNPVPPPYGPFAGK